LRRNEQNFLTGIQDQNHEQEHGRLYKKRESRIRRLGAQNPKGHVNGVKAHVKGKNVLDSACDFVLFVNEQEGSCQNRQWQENFFQENMDKVSEKGVGRQKIVWRKEILVGAKNCRQKDSQKRVKIKRSPRTLF